MDDVNKPVRTARRGQEGPPSVRRVALASSSGPIQAAFPSAASNAPQPASGPIVRTSPGEPGRHTCSSAPDPIAARVL